MLGFDAGSFEFVPVTAELNGHWRCTNFHGIGCNWTAGGEGVLCPSCTRTANVPGTMDGTDIERRSQMESAKRRLLYQLLRTGLLGNGPYSAGGTDLAFDFLKPDNAEGAVTGHANGTVTVLLPEADPAERERLRKEMSEPYRTIIGHLRHEVGHYYWMLFFRDVTDHKNFRELFGDDSIDYSAALDEHYRNGPLDNWAASFISAYASSHPLEDWAETWAHYLHLTDTLETANSSGIGIPYGARGGPWGPCPDPYGQIGFDEILERGMALTRIGNGLNRSMGIPDIYPFVLVDPVIEKLRFIDGLVRPGS